MTNNLNQQQPRRPTLTSRVDAMAEQLAQLAAKVDTLDQKTTGTQPAGNGKQRYFPSLDEFVNLWLLPTFRRPVAALGMGSWHWCPRWVGHPEARMVFGALWDSFETGREEPLGMVEFTRDVLGFLPQVCGAHGPFARCRSDPPGVGRHQHVPVFPTTPAPPGWWEGWWGNDDHTDPDRPQLLYPGVEQFVRDLLLPTFRRDPNAVGMMRWSWCDQWWRHDETVHHYLNLWYLFEARAPQRRLVEFVREVYFLLPHLHGEAGPMRECTPSGRPGGPKHTDLSIAPVEDQPNSHRRGGDAGWLGDLIASLKRRLPAAAPTPAATLHEGHAASANAQIGGEHL